MHHDTNDTRPANDIYVAITPPSLSIRRRDPHTRIQFAHRKAIHHTRLHYHTPVGNPIYLGWKDRKLLIHRLHRFSSSSLSSVVVLLFYLSPCFSHMDSMSIIIAVLSFLSLNASFFLLSPLEPKLLLGPPFSVSGETDENLFLLHTVLYCDYGPVVPV